MNSHPKSSMIGIVLLATGFFLATSQEGTSFSAAQQPEPTVEKRETVRDAAADASNAKVADILGRDILPGDLNPPIKWMEDREKHLKLHGETSGLVSVESYRSNKLCEIIWKSLSEKYIDKKEVEPTEEELQEFIAHHRLTKERMKREQQERLDQLRIEAHELEKQSPTQDEEEQEQTANKLENIRNEISANEKSFEINRGIDGKGKDFEQFFAKWWVGNWKQQRWFYKRYGGRVIYQQVGPQAVDAMRDFLKEAESKKDFVIYDQEMNAKFWVPYNRELLGVVVPNPDEVFEHPWSISDRPAIAKRPPIATATKNQPPDHQKTTPESSDHSTKAEALPLELSLEDNSQAEVTIMLGCDKTLTKTLPGSMMLDLTAAGDGQHHIFFHCPGYASQWDSVEIAGGITATKKIHIKLHHKRYVILRCAFNTKGGRNLEGNGVEEQRLALPHWTGPKYFQQDWQIWQQNINGEKIIGDTLYLNFHRISRGFGFVVPAVGVSYIDMSEAPEEGYKCKNMKAKKGLVLYCRVNGNRAEGLGYGKLLVEDVTETPPDDVQILEYRQ